MFQETKNEAFNPFFLFGFKGIRLYGPMSSEFDLVKRFRTITLLVSPEKRKQELYDQLCKLNRSISPSFLVGLEEYGVTGPIRTNNYIALREFITPRKANEVLSVKHLNQLTFKAYLLFGEVAKLQSYIMTTSRLSKQPPTSRVEAINKLTFPPSAHWGAINFRKWGEAFIQHGDRAATRFTRLSTHTEPSLSNDGRISLPLTEFNYLAQKHKNDRNAAQIDSLIRLSVKFNKQTNEFQRALTCFLDTKSDAAPPSFRQQLPPLEIEGSKFDLDDAVFRKLNRHDPRLLYLGDFTKCCQRVTNKENSLEREVLQARKTDYNGYYVVERGDEILASSWAWRGNNSELVFDGFESNKDRFKSQHLHKLLKSVEEKAAESAFEKYNLNGIFVGLCAEHLGIRSHIMNVQRSLIIPKKLDKVGMTYDELKMVAPPKDKSFVYLPSA